MKKITLSIFAFILLSVMTTTAQTVLIDLGWKWTPMSGNWNNIVRSDTASFNTDTLSNIIDNNGTLTNLKLKVKDTFDSYNRTGYSTTSADALTNGFSGNASIDSWYVYNGGKGIIRIWGLDVNKVYSFTFYSTRSGATDIRTGRLIATGQNAVKDSLDASNNSSNVKTISNIIPTASGYIDLTFEAAANNNNASKYSYLNALKIVASTPVTTKINSVNETIFSARLVENNLIVGDYTGTVKIYAINGKLVAGGQAVFGYMPLELQKGIYFVETTQGKCKLLVH